MVCSLSFDLSFLSSDTPPKIDVELNWQGTDLRISAKNVSFKKSHTWVTVVSESPLLSMIQDIDGDFVNHWINLHAIHGTSQKAKAEKKNTNIVFSERILSSKNGKSIIVILAPKI